MNLWVDLADPCDPASRALLDASHALMQSLYPPEDNYYLEADQLAAPDIRFFVANLDGQVCGCAALALRGQYGEIKSMFVEPEARGAGVAPH